VLVDQLLFGNEAYMFPRPRVPGSWIILLLPFENPNDLKGATDDSFALDEEPRRDGDGVRKGSVFWNADVR
jgi:hypothetical protein